MSKANKQSSIITMIAETHIHAGIGQSTGALDLPVARERTTHYPFIPGSGVKGAFRVWAEERASGLKVDELFGLAGDDTGGDGGAGNLLCSDARLLLLPVRCLSDAYKWVTCPAILNRFMRDCTRAKTECIMTVTDPGPKKYFGDDKTGDWLGLEEREFECAGSVDPSIITALQKVVGDDLAGSIENRLVILSNKDFTWFARYALPVMARNALDENKIVKGGALWYEETLAPDTVMYVLFGERQPAVEDITKAITQAEYIQIGGNETIGQGWFKMTEYPQPVQGGTEDG